MLLLSVHILRDLLRHRHPAMQEPKSVVTVDDSPIPRHIRDFNA